ncbi:mRNA 3'-end-processing protein-like protein [Hapsidospora chrysogenum ATCC 11550]|uniref:mRNA 3'-end-processing protein n=1 Tax=Hapsidospora chrysogenum (strain ATCC 11550 / CBS 779.69 / DSM 880 / IAM 14645 / JCM 23072 / IMI 49137) TaxID=857340 RepID=A0A086TAT3_HAPC1|nr:mRNA 3'-end-processing protein-like protein [Hapsidospora chrysogenum ATCC 11550]
MSTATSPQAAASAILNHTAPTYTFRFSPFLRQTYQVGLPPDRPICRSFQTGTCPNGTRCPERHVPAPTSSDPSAGGGKAQQGGLNSLVCKHWLRGLCKKGEHCEFLHEYNLRKMPECNFFMRNGYCSNGDECLYLHIDPMSRLPPCPHYDMGFCPLGPRCSKKHVRRKLCPYYLAGFCPDGPECKAGAHPKWRKDLEKPRAMSEERAEEEANKMEASRDEDSDRMQRDGHQPQRDQDGARFSHRGRGGGRWRGAGGGGGGGRGRYRGRGH